MYISFTCHVSHGGADDDDDMMQDRLLIQNLYIYFFFVILTLFTFVSKVNKANNNSHDKDTLLKYLTLFNLHI